MRLLAVVSGKSTPPTATMPSRLLLLLARSSTFSNREGVLSVSGSWRVCRVRDAMPLQLAGSCSGLAPVRTPNLVGDFLGQARTPRWFGDPYGVDEHGTHVMGPERVSLPNIAARSRSGCHSLPATWQPSLASPCGPAQRPPCTRQGICFR